jgi:hypothetical protein
VQCSNDEEIYSNKKKGTQASQTTSHEEAGGAWKTGDLDKITNED